MAGAGAMVGAVLNGKWRLLKLLGEGGMGAVFAAEEINGDSKRAIKILHPEFINEPQILQRFFAEAQATQHLQHPNIARVYEHTQAEDGSPYLVMELLHGIPLSEYVQPNHPVPSNQAAPIIYGVLQALVAAHGQNIIHRDLKPDNIYLVPDANGRYTVKVLDFGIAKVMDAAGGMGSKTRTGMMLGTPGYMSPEQIKNSKGVDPRSDLWSVGIMYYEMLTGGEAFEAPTDFAKLTAVLTQDPKPISAVAPHLSGWQEFFRRAIAREPADRFSTADEMARVLLATARAIAGAAQLPTAEFRSIRAQPPPGSDTHVSPQLPSPPRSVPPPAIQVVAVGPSRPDQTAAVERAGVRPVYVGMIGLVCFMFGVFCGVVIALIATY